MKVAKDTVVKFHYRLKEEDNLIEESFSGEPVLNLIGHRQMISGLEENLLGKSAGDNFTVELVPEDAYGLRHEREPQRVPIKHLQGKPKKVKKGQIVHVNTSQGVREATVIKAGKFNVDIDTNHPLAGKHLSFEIEILDVREASAEEVSHGHAHGIGGHQH